jgi:acetyl esterase/lipase
VTANITYRLVAEAPWPAALEDVKCAIRWMRANAAELGLDPTRIAVCGGSAGGHLAAMAALTPGRLEGGGGNASTSSAVAAAALFYPAVDLDSFRASDDAKAAIAALVPNATPSELLAASPVGNVAPGAPPFLSLTGDADTATPEADIARFHALLDDAGVPNELVVFEGRDHGFDFNPYDWNDAFQRMAAFLEENLGDKGSESSVG